MTKTTALVWLRNDLRIADNPALAAAVAESESVTALYIHETDPSLRAPGGAARWWLHHSLEDLGHRLAEKGIPLVVEHGAAADTLDEVLRDTGARSVHWNRRYAPSEREIDATIKTRLGHRQVKVHSHPGNVLVEPWLIATKEGHPYSVFTPFWSTLKTKDIAALLKAPSGGGSARPSGLFDRYTQPRWAKKFAQHWAIGEAAAIDRLHDFLDESLDDYPTGRDFPARDVTSRLSPHLRFGEISARQVWQAAKARSHAHPGLANAVEKFLSELAWRDFSYHQLYHREDIAKVPMQPKYGRMAWRNSARDLQAWQRGQTGIPIVDAGMRELWETGYMHNRVRMLVASLLSKNMLLDWREGEAWFWDCLVDSDVANNSASWQWVAGTGLDASPYFRIFNPVTQGGRFDADGSYVRRWVPELAALPNKHLHDPAAAPPEVLAQAGITLGLDYPTPIVDLKASRERALAAQSNLS
ncbi:deoxyribodipyrimidine photo-lyase [Devosia sp. PTR5]|uniref:Deoxyribodipyrimidine photo-lyase n=1 Tax=Devosia oryzisoli TaxID=2774138 RepID=A0A927ISN8_9HYPH|nr:deoxyribodipyrimidine photo-lyase [Devosia oryzisoli]